MLGGCWAGARQAARKAKQRTKKQNEKARGKARFSGIQDKEKATDTSAVRLRGDAADLVTAKVQQAARVPGSGSENEAFEREAYENSAMTPTSKDKGAVPENHRLESFRGRVQVRDLTQEEMKMYLKAAFWRGRNAKRTIPRGSTLSLKDLLERRFPTLLGTRTALQMESARWVR